MVHIPFLLDLWYIPFSLVFPRRWSIHTPYHFLLCDLGSGERLREGGFHGGVHPFSLGLELRRGCNRGYEEATKTFK